MVLSRITTFIFAILISIVSLANGNSDNGGLLTPLEASDFAALPSSKEIAEFLQKLSESSPMAAVVPLGRSAGDRPLQALCLSADTSFCQHGNSQPGKLSVLLVGSQHGTEPSGSEALQRAARELLHGSLRTYLSTMDFILVVNANPDGRDRHRRTNANKVNLSTDFILLSEPESRALVAVLNRFQPEVILDIHESALLKKRSLGAQGYLTDFEAQFETANNPNVDSSLRQWSQESFLPGVLAATNARGLRARHYIGEITDINQPITHGGLSPRTLRNYAGIKGSLSVLVENRLDPSGEYSTPRNIASRVNKQFVSISVFLAQCQANRSIILQRVQVARNSTDSSVKPQLSLVARYVPAPGNPTITLPMRRRDTGVIEQHVFDYHSRVAASENLLMPESYYVLDHEQDMTALLERHGIPYKRVQLDTRRRVIFQRIETVQAPIRDSVTGKRQPPRITLSERPGVIHPGPHYLSIDLRGPPARLVPLLLDPRSASSVFHSNPYAQLLVPGSDLFVARNDGRREPVSTP